MRALVLEEYGRLGVQDRADPVPSAGEVLVEVAATGICGSDLHGFTGENGRRVPGQVMGHETVGRVRATGPGVDAALVGTTVVINPVIGCGHCAECVAAQGQRCARKQVLGVSPERTAAFAEFVVVPAANAVEFTAAAIELGALVEPLAVGYHAALRGGIGPGDRVLVLGAGAIGQACAIAARRRGATAVAMSEPDPARRTRAEALGLPCLDPLAGDLADRVPAALDGTATVVVDAVGSTASLRDALTSSLLGGRVVLVGMNQPDLELPAYRVSTDERSIIGSFCYSDEEFRSTARWVSEHADEVASLIDERVDLDEAPDAFVRLTDGTAVSCKVMVFPRGRSALQT